MVMSVHRGDGKIPPSEKYVEQVDYTAKVSALAPLASSTAKAAAALGTGGERLAPMWFR